MKCNLIAAAAVPAFAWALSAASSEVGPGNVEVTHHRYRLPDTKLSDDQLEAAITVGLRRDPLIDASTIEVDSMDHVVTLTGTQPLLIARDRATYLAETVRGVGQVINDIDVVTGRDVDAERLEADIMYALLTDPATERNEFTVEASNTGNVILRGTVASGAERSIAEKIVKSIVGVRSVIDEVELRRSANRPDTKILADVQHVLRSDAYVDSARILVNVHGGIVTLSGDVNSPAEKRRAAGLCWVLGAMRVNVVPLRIRWGQKPPADAAPRAPNINTKTEFHSDAAVAEAIRLALAHDPRVSAADVDVKVQNHVVTLSGTADDLRAKRLAARLPYEIRGVRSVRDRLRLPESGAFDDDEIRRRVQRALDKNSATTDDAILLLVRDGAVTLQGVADDRYTRTIAEDLTASVRGVRSISNRLRVDVNAKRLFYDPYVDSNSAIDYQIGESGSDQTTDTVSDADSIAEDVRRELWWSPFVDESDIQVLANAAVVTLRGTVDGEAERRAAIESAFEGGAVSVKDRLVVAE